MNQPGKETTIHDTNPHFVHLVCNVELEYCIVYCDICELLVLCLLYHHVYCCSIMSSSSVVLLDITDGVATISRLLKMIGLFCKRALQKRQFSAKETYNFKEPTNRSHPISSSLLMLFLF